ncbi:gamma-glutamylcyclotransferase [Candidatus Parcubacteria bacterium]|nr:MAG: gamma-glutamylcyclotransferase [Candidatus Parcubacteria bacterium]
MEKLFVYGTLLQGQNNHKRMMPKIGAQFVEEATLSSAWMYNRGPFPVIYLDTENQSPQNYVKGELYEVSPEALLELDWFEGVAGGFYQRVKTQVTPVEEERDDEEIDCWVYCLTQRPTNLPLIKSGDWKAFQGIEPEEDWDFDLDLEFDEEDDDEEWEDDEGEDYYTPEYDDYDPSTGV